MTESDVEQRIDELYGRIVRLKPKIIEVARCNVEAAVRDLYQSPQVKAMKLGEGTEHSVYNAGRVYDGEKEVHLALRLQKREPCLQQSNVNPLKNPIAEEMMTFELAHASGERIPYFVAVFTFPIEWTYCKKGGRAVGIITEDISAAKKNRLRVMDYSRVKVESTGLVYFIDPNIIDLKVNCDFKKMDEIRKHSRLRDYFADARIDF